MILLLIRLSILFLAFNVYAEDIQLTSDFILHKPNIASTKLLNKDEQRQVRDALISRERILISVKLTPAKNDYKNDFSRGTVFYTPNCRNYSYHNVIIPDGTIIQDTNFTQRLPHTKAITGKGIIFKDCNLVNNEIDPTWKINSCTTVQIKRIIKSKIDKDMKLSISSVVEQPDGTFKEENSEEKIYMDSDSYNNAILKYSD